MFLQYYNKMNTEKENYQDNSSQEFSREANNNENSRGGYYRRNNDNDNYGNNDRGGNYRSNNRSYNDNNRRPSYNSGNRSSYNNNNNDRPYNSNDNRRDNNYRGGNNYNNNQDGQRRSFNRNNDSNRPSYNNSYRNNDGDNAGGYNNRRYNNNSGGYNNNRNYSNNNSYGQRSERPSFQRNDDSKPRRPRIDRNNEGGGSRGGYNNNYSNNNYGGRSNNNYGNNRYNNRDSYNRGGGQRNSYNNNGNFGGNNYDNRDSFDQNAKYSVKKQIEYKETQVDPNEPLRLNKYLANAGVCSRREADEFIAAGAVAVNDQIVTELGTKVKRADEVRFNGDPVSIERKMYVLLNKPKDFVTTMDDPEERRTVMDLVKESCEERIYPVGRLDKKTTGVLLLTNDGELASKLTHPKYDKKKIYQITTDRNVARADMEKILEGIELSDGEIKADAIDYTDPRKMNQVGIEIHSGRNRIVRRIFESLGYKVVKLDRVFFAGLTKKGLRRGEWRYLTQQEVNFLQMGSF